MKTNVLAAVMVAFVSVGVFAEDPVGFQPWRKIFEEADTNKSGGLTLEECQHYSKLDQYPGFLPWFRDHFSDMDLNSDGQVTLAEMDKSMAAMKMKDAEVETLWREGIGFQPGK